MAFWGFVGGTPFYNALRFKGLQGVKFLISFIPFIKRYCGRKTYAPPAIIFCLFFNPYRPTKTPETSANLRPPGAFARPHEKGTTADALAALRCSGVPVPVWLNLWNFRNTIKRANTTTAPEPQGSKRPRQFSRVRHGFACLFPACNPARKTSTPYGL